MHVIENLEEQHHRLDTGQRIGVALLIGITVLIATVTVIQFRSSFSQYGHGKKIAGDGQPADPQQAQKKADDALRKTDTDGDGLSDYDEIMIYHSSPYIRDTDSDGIPDGEEVRRGTSPVCPEGKDCSIDEIAAHVAKQSPTSTDPIGDPLLTGSGVLNTQSALTITPSPTVSPQQPAAAPPDVTKMTPADIRTLMITHGVPKNKLDALTDEQLMLYVQQASAEDAQQPKNSP